jgi:hypothetical protein
MAAIAGGKARIVPEYLKYKKHVSRQVYEHVSDWQQEGRMMREEAWPEYSRRLSQDDVAHRQCRCFLPRLDQTNGHALGGRRSKLGSFRGPQNEENLNGTHPATCAAMQTNSDVQLPYRFVGDTFLADPLFEGPLKKHIYIQVLYFDRFQVCKMLS